LSACPLQRHVVTASGVGACVGGVGAIVVMRGADDVVEVVVVVVGRGGEGAGVGDEVVASLTPARQWDQNPLPCGSARAVGQCSMTRHHGSGSLDHRLQIASLLPLTQRHSAECADIS
jgi:hypothetical protein